VTNVVLHLVVLVAYGLGGYLIAVRQVRKRLSI
jgi:hypothetical protein